MVINVYRFLIQESSVQWHGNLTHPYPIRYIYGNPKDYIAVEE
jgi:hypothetical protein